MQQTIDKLVRFIRESVEGARAKGAVVGVSGGLDSAVVLGLCKLALPNGTLGLILPCYSDPVDKELALRVIRKFDVPHREIVLDCAYDEMMKVLGESPSRLAMANVKVRLRMIAWYYFANTHNYLVIGTSNKAELTMGYFTKYGDGGTDIVPLARLPKCQVREMAHLLGVPQEIIDRPPTAGLWPGQTDEGEMGITYTEIDRYLLTGEASPQTRAIIEKRRAAAAHKMHPPVLPSE
jgi:NAD+ synthase